MQMGVHACNVRRAVAKPASQESVRVRTWRQYSALTLQRRDATLPHCRLHVRRQRRGDAN